MNRRGFLGFLGVGAAAAPVIARELSQAKPVIPNEPVVGYPNKDGYDMCTLGYGVSAYDDGTLGYSSASFSDDVILYGVSGTAFAASPQRYRDGA